MWIKQKNNYLILIFLFLDLSACSHFRGKKTENLKKSPQKKMYLLTDKSGKFLAIVESGHKNKGTEFVLKRQILAENGDETKPFERAISISKLTSHSKDVPVLRPYISEYNVWFDGEKHTSQMQFKENGQLEVEWKSEKKIDEIKKKSFLLPKGNGVYCFFSQVLECAKVSGFIQMAIEKSAGKMNFQVIWDGFPYFQQQYNTLDEMTYSNASLEFDGESEEGEKRFSLNSAGANILYYITKDLKLSKVFWVAEGLSMTELNYVESEKIDSEALLPKNSIPKIDEEIDE